MPKRFHGRWCSYETSAHLCGAQSDFGGRLSQVVGNRTKNDSWLQKTSKKQSSQVLGQTSPQEVCFTVLSPWICSPKTDPKKEANLASWPSNPIHLFQEDGCCYNFKGVTPWVCLVTHIEAQRHGSLVQMIFLFNGVYSQVPGVNFQLM